MAETTMRCERDNAPMRLKERLDFPTGPSKLIYECEANPSHVLIVDAQPTSEATPGPVTWLPHERIQDVRINSDQTEVRITSESGQQVVIQAENGAKLKIETEST